MSARRPRRPTVRACLAAAACVIAGLPPAAAATSGDGPRLLFSSSRGGDFDLYTMRVDGTDVRRLPPPPADPLRPDELQAMPSPDGRRIAYVRGRGHGPSPENAEVWVTDHRGREHRRLISGGVRHYRPTWSPDGRWLAVSVDTASPVPGSQVVPGAQLVLFEAGTGRRVRQLTSAPAFNTFASWSPDGRQIVFAGLRERGQNVYVLDVASGRERALTSTTTNAAPWWSPDGGRIYYHSQLSGDQDVWSIDAAGATLPRNETATSGDSERFPVLSPDGTLLTYGLVDASTCRVQLAACPSSIAVRRVGSAAPARVLRSGFFDSFAAFLPAPR